MTYEIPNDATNKDVLKIIFPNLEYNEDEYFEVVRIYGKKSIGTIKLDWFNAPYKTKS